MHPTPSLTASFDARAAFFDRSSDTSDAFAERAEPAFDARELAAAAGSNPAAPAARPRPCPTRRAPHR